MAFCVEFGRSVAVGSNGGGGSLEVTGLEGGKKSSWRQAVSKAYLDIAGVVRWLPRAAMLLYL